MVPMSLDTWSMSFAKYLELHFHSSSYGRRGCLESCTHSLHHDHYQYFGCRKIVASFRYEISLQIYYFIFTLYSFSIAPCHGRLLCRSLAMPYLLPHSLPMYFLITHRSFTFSFDLHTCLHQVHISFPHHIPISS